MWHHNGSGMKLGQGGRFNALETKLASRPGVHNPAALAAAIGRRIHGQQQMTKWSKAGENRKYG